jgi:hypothetical protein
MAKFSIYKFEINVLNFTCPVRLREDITVSVLDSRNDHELRTSMCVITVFGMNSKPYNAVSVPEVSEPNN